MPSPQRTVFIIISRSFLTRNILRSGTLAHLKRGGHRIVIFFQATHIPDHIRTEFEDEQCSVHACDIPMRPLHRRVNRLKRYLIDTKTTRLIVRFDTKKKETGSNGVVSSVKKSYVRIWVGLILVKFLGHIPFAKGIFRVIEQRVFPQRSSVVESYFDQYCPDVIVSTSLISSLDIVFLKAAHRRGVRTVSMPKGWDNVTKELYPVLPDSFAVPNRIFERCAYSLQRAHPGGVEVVGIPQFDWYARPDLDAGREEHLRAKGLDPSRKLIFFGSEGSWSVNDVAVARMLYEWVRTDAFGMSVQLIIRPHYSNAYQNVFAGFQGKAHVVVDEFKIVNFLTDKWDPSVEETEHFVRTIAAADVVVNVASSLALDAASADRPAVFIGFGCEFENGKDVTIPKLYGSDHMQWALSTGACPLARTPEELKALISKALTRPGDTREARARMREELCYRIDGRSSERLAEVITPGLY